MYAFRMFGNRFRRRSDLIEEVYEVSELKLAVRETEQLATRLLIYTFFQALKLGLDRDASESSRYYI